MRHQFRQVAGSTNAVSRMNAADALGTQQVGAADQAMQSPVLDDWQTMNAAVGHRQHGFKAGRIRRQGDTGWGS
jgi:hypothetical protein